MRIALVVPAFPKLSESFIVSKLHGLLEAGWDAHVVCQTSEPAEWQRFPQLQQYPRIRNRIHVTAPVTPRWKLLLHTPSVLTKLVHRYSLVSQYGRSAADTSRLHLLKQLYLDAELIALQPDLIHFEFGTLARDRMHLKERLRCSITVSFRGYDLNFVGLDQPDFYATVWEKADALHLLGHDLWQRARNRGCPSDKPHALIPPAINTTYFSPSPSTDEHDEQPLRILSVGRLEWKKGYEYALLAIRRLRDAGVSCEYHIIGDGRYLEPIAFLRHQLQLEDVVHLIGPQPRSEVKAKMEWADLFLHAAVSEGFCNAVIEAQAMELPVVTSDADGLSENVVDGVTGFVVPRRNPQALAEKLLLLANDPQLRRRMGQAGRKRVLDCFQLPQQIEAFDRFYRSVLNDENH